MVISFLFSKRGGSSVFCERGLGLESCPYMLWDFLGGCMIFDEVTCFLENINELVCQDHKSPKFANELKVYW